MPAAHHGLDALPVAAPRLPPVVARAIRLPPRGPIHGPRNPGDRGLRSRRRAPRDGGPRIRWNPPIPPLRAPSGGVAGSNGAPVPAESFRAEARPDDLF